MWRCFAASTSAAGTDCPDSAEASSLDPNRSPPDSFQLRGREIFLHCPNGVARSKLTNAYFDAKLGTTSTARNWRTVLKLNELAGSGRQNLR